MVERPVLKGIKETCIYSRDLHRSREFYENIMGLECFSMVEDSQAFFRAGHSVLLCFDPQSSKTKSQLPRHFGEGELHFAFEVEKKDYSPWLDRLKELGVAIEHEHEWPGGFRSFYFRDPDRHCVEIIEAGMWEYGWETK